MAETLVSLDAVSKAFFIPTSRRTTIREHAFGLFERHTVERLQVLDLVAYERTAPADAFGVENGYVVETPADSFTNQVQEKAEALTPSQLLQRRAAQVASEAPAALAQADADEVPF